METTCRSHPSLYDLYGMVRYVFGWSFHIISVRWHWESQTIKPKFSWMSNQGFGGLWQVANLVFGFLRVNPCLSWLNPSVLWLDIDMSQGDWLPWALAHEREGQRHAARGMVPASGHGMSLGGHGGHGGHGGPWAMARRVASFTWWIRMTSRSWRTGVVLGILFSISFQIRGFKFVRARPRSSFQTLPDVWKRMWRSISTSSSRTEPGPLHKGFPQSFASASLDRWRQRERESLLHSFTLAHPMHRLIWGYAGTPHSNSHRVQQERPQHSSLWKVHCLDPRRPFLARLEQSTAWWRWTSWNSRIKILHSPWLAIVDVSGLFDRRVMLAHAEMFFWQELVCS